MSKACWAHSILLVEEKGGFMHLKSVATLVSAVLFAGAQSSAQEFDLDKYFTITSTTIEATESGDAWKANSSLKDLAPSLTECRNRDVGNRMANDLENPISLDDILNFGKKVWEIIVENQPQVNASFMAASAMPAGLNCWDQMESWSVPEVKNFKIVLKNAFNVEVIVFNYRLVYTYGGSYKGTGKYLASVKVLPSEISVAWGYKFNATTSIPHVFNSGTTADPVGSMEVLVDWSVSTPLQYKQQSQGYYVDGRGSFKSLN